MSEIKTGHGLFTNMSRKEFDKFLDGSGIEYYRLGEHIDRLKSLRSKSQSFANANVELSAMYQNDVETLDFVIQALESRIGIRFTTGCRYCDCDGKLFPHEDIPNIPDRFVNGELTGAKSNTYLAFDVIDRDWCIYMPMGSNIPITHCPYCGRELPK